MRIIIFLQQFALDHIARGAIMGGIDKHGRANAAHAALTTLYRFYRNECGRANECGSCSDTVALWTPYRFYRNEDGSLALAKPKDDTGLNAAA